MKGEREAELSVSADEALKAGLGVKRGVIKSCLMLKQLIIEISRMKET